MTLSKSMRMRAVVGIVAAAIASIGLTCSAYAFHEAPGLDALVKAGKLPPVDQRLPEEPAGREAARKVGKYGGTWRQGMIGGSRFADRAHHRLHASRALEPRLDQGRAGRRREGRC